MNVVADQTNVQGTIKLTQLASCSTVSNKYEFTSHHHKQSPKCCVHKYETYSTPLNVFVMVLINYSLGLHGVHVVLDYRFTQHTLNHRQMPNVFSHATGEPKNLCYTIRPQDYRNNVKFEELQF